MSIIKLISWNCSRGLLTKEKYKKLQEFSPDIAIIQESPEPSKFNDDFNYDDAKWIGKEGGIGLCVISFSDDYKLTVLDDEIKYEWIVPIKVTGKADFVMIAVWTKRVSGYSSYGHLLYTAIEEYKILLNNSKVIIIGDFNVDKNLKASYSGIQGFNQFIALFNKYGLKSCYHHFYNEEFGLESKPTYFHQRKLEKPFHIDYCFVSKDILQIIQKFYLGDLEEWFNLSSHLPLILEIALSPTERIANDDVALINRKIENKKSEK
ncbi:hypothetical protein ACJ2A9_21830 [Anaerobacillus sp. MEB173]|uniref:hypothetical protein n=1 Tax=Anaerobacillus sp. MEB173 TaxID=3383345 RepID=UPI003F8F8647